MRLLLLLALGAALLYAAVQPWTGRIFLVRQRGAVARELYEDFREALQRGDRAVAFDRAAAAVAASPALLWTRPLPAGLLAEEAFWEAVAEASARASEDALGAFVHGWALRRAGHPEAAEQVLLGMPERDTFRFAFFDRVWEPWLEIARARLQRGATDGAREALSHVHAASALEVLALTYVLEGLPDGGTTRSRLEAIHDPVSARAEVGRAALLAGRPELAAAHFEAALRCLPESARLRFDWGVALERSGQVEAGRAAQARALEEGRRLSLYSRY